MCVKNSALENSESYIHKLHRYGQLTNLAMVNTYTNVNRVFLLELSIE